MAVLCGVYTLFFAVQAAEFAAALGAPLPLTAPDAAAFAVNGFWEFCRILALDLTVLAALHFLGAQPVTQKGLSPRVGRGAVRVRCRVCDASRGQAGGVYQSVQPNGAAHLGCVGAGSIVTGQCSGCGAVVPLHPGGTHAFVAAAFSFSLLCCLPLERFCVDAQLARPDCDWQLLQRYTWQSSELDEYITQQAGGKRELVGARPLHPC